ncbi:uncharacterized protein LOC144583718 [Pogona vitticeps]
MSSVPASCEEVGNLALQLLGALALLCVAANAVSLVCLRCSRRAGSRLPEPASSPEDRRPRSALKRPASPGSRAAAAAKTRWERAGSPEEDKRREKPTSPTRFEGRPAHCLGSPVSEQAAPKKAAPPRLVLPSARPPVSACAAMQHPDGPARGQVLYDVRRLRCVVGRAAPAKPLAR